MGCTSSTEALEEKISKLKIERNELREKRKKKISRLEDLTGDKVKREPVPDCFVNIKKLKKPNNKDKPENKIEEKNIIKENLNVDKNEIENNEIKSNENSNIKTKDTNLVEDIPKNIEINKENKLIGLFKS